jgi:hypothetical protein
VQSLKVRTRIDQTGKVKVVRGYLKE